MLTDTDEGLLHVIMDHITMAILPQIAICLSELTQIAEETPEPDDTRAEELKTELETIGTSLSELILEIVQGIDGDIFIPTQEEIKEMLEGFASFDFEEDQEDGFLGFMQEIVDNKEEEE